VPRARARSSRTDPTENRRPLPWRRSSSFNLSSLEPTPELLRTPIAHVQRDRYGTKAIDVDLTPSSLFPKWQAAVDEAAKRQQEEQDRHKPAPRTR
jgi:hypothetical protein